MILDRFQSPDSGDDNRFREYGRTTTETKECRVCKGMGFFDVEKYGTVIQEDCGFCHGTGEVEASQEQ